MTSSSSDEISSTRCRCREFNDEIMDAPACADIDTTARLVENHDARIGMTHLASSTFC